MDTEKGFTLEQEKEIKEIVGELVSRMGFSAEISLGKADEEGAIVCDIKTNDSNFLIGQYGANLQYLQHLARLLVRKKVSAKTNFILDVNSYRQEKNESLIRLAKNLSDQAVSERRAVVMRPMSPYERRVIHLELSRDARIRTESIGEGDDRRVVIKPVDLI